MLSVLFILSIGFFPFFSRAEEVREVEKSLAERDFSQYKVGFLRKSWLNFELRWSRDPARRLEIAFELWADSFYRLDKAKAGNNKVKAKRLLAKYAERTRVFESNLKLAQAILAELEVDKILGIERIATVYKDISKDVINVAYGLQIIFQEDEEVIQAVKNIEIVSSQADKEIEVAVREAERVKSDPVYRDYIELLNSPNLSEAQKGLLTLNYFKALRVK